MSELFGNPLSQLLSLQRALSRARTGSLLDAVTSGRGAYPPINVFRDAGDYILVTELPGVARDAIDVQVHRNRVRLTGSKALNYGDETSMHRKERGAGSFDRTVTLPFSVDPDSVTAELQNGVLALKLSPPQEEQPRSIALN